MTPEQLARAIDCPLPRAARWAPHLDAAMARYDISTIARTAHFLAQVGHESGRLRYVRELASGAAYEGRKDLGNTEPGDGVRFKGRGLIQVTGRRNYTLCGLALELDLLNAPELLELPVNAALSAAWFWWNAGLNELADKDEFRKITRRINGGYNGLADRHALLESVKAELSA